MISQDIREKLKIAMREKDQTALDTYRGALAAFTSELVVNGKTPQDEVSDEMALKVIQKLIKQRRDSISHYEVGGRADLVENEQAQLRLLQQFQPSQLSDEEIIAIVQAKKTELNFTDKTKSGMLVGAVMKEIGGRADGGRVKTIVESLL